MMKLSENQCPVCCTTYNMSQIFSIANCNHFFCRNCCQQHIEARLAGFQSISCLDNKCGKKFTRVSPIFESLSTQTKKKIGKYQQFVALQTNRNLKPCKKDQCLGIIDINRLQKDHNNIDTLLCRECLSYHCLQCYELIHIGQKCRQMNAEQRQKQQQLMKMLNYRKCPTCSIWVEKSGGCRYLVCKCKTQFCFTCGQKFQDDPCRKISFRQNQKQIWQLIRASQNMLVQPTTALGYLCFLPRIILKLILSILFTSFSGILFVGFIFAVFIPLLYLVSPAGVIVLVGELHISGKIKLLLRLLTVILYPLVGSLAVVGVSLLFLTYPLMRILIQAHIYDQMDRFMNQVTIVYLKGMQCIAKI